jgi:hypothetical protein
MVYEWVTRAVCYYYCDVETGKIIGKVSRVSLGDDIWFATVNGDSLGDYISLTKAMSAVYTQVVKNDNNDNQAKLFEKEVYETR